MIVIPRTRQCDAPSKTVRAVQIVLGKHLGRGREQPRLAEFPCSVCTGWKRGESKSRGEEQEVMNAGLERSQQAVCRSGSTTQ